MRRISTIFVIGLTLSLPITTTALACGFDSRNHVSIDIQRIDGPVKFNNSLSRTELTNLQRRSGQGGLIGAGWAPVGLTLTELKYQIKVRVEALRLGPGRYCARLTNVDARLGYDGFDVYVERRFRPGTCAYDSINDHEMTHVAIFRNALNTFHPRLRQRLTRVATTIKPIRAGNPEAAAKRLQKRLRDAINPLFREMNRTLDRENARLDTPERYRQEQSRCNEW